MFQNSGTPEAPSTLYASQHGQILQSREEIPAIEKRMEDLKLDRGYFESVRGLYAFLAGIFPFPGLYGAVKELFNE